MKNILAVGQDIARLAASAARGRCRLGLASTPSVHFDSSATRLRRASAASFCVNTSTSEQLACTVMLNIVSFWRDLIHSTHVLPEASM